MLFAEDRETPAGIVSTREVVKDQAELGYKQQNRCSSASNRLIQNNPDFKDSELVPLYTPHEILEEAGAKSTEEQGRVPAENLEEEKKK